MKRLDATLAVSFIVLFVTLATGARAECAYGDVVTISGEIADIEDPFEPGTWALSIKNLTSGDCSLDGLTGAGAPPASCTAGRRFEATGHVNVVVFIAWEMAVLETSHLSCR